MRVSSVIPKIFHKSDGGLLENCIMCNRCVTRPAQDYFIEKAFRFIPSIKKREVIFEYAMCIPCAEAMRNELSTESKSRIELYFKQNVNFENRSSLLQPKRAPFSKWINKCLIKNEDLFKSSEYSIYGHAYGKRLVYGLFPYAISGAVMEEVNELISEKTREVLDDFIGNHFSGPPEVAEILKRRPVLV